MSDAIAVECQLQHRLKGSNAKILNLVKFPGQQVNCEMRSAVSCLRRQLCPDAYLCSFKAGYGRKHPEIRERTHSSMASERSLLGNGLQDSRRCHDRSDGWDSSLYHSF
jgi:hypothetical protein